MDKTSAAAVRVPREGELIAGFYAVESALGQGGMGAVFQVRDVRSGRRIALKCLHAKHGRSALRLFEREYFTLSELAHPRIIEVYDYGVDAEGAYYTMELLDGADLRERKDLSAKEICALLCDVASSLAILHSRGLVHRDVSPRNVRCTANGRAKLIDFGAMAPMGIMRELSGTPPCVPPEALQFQSLDGRADLYALGAVAYRMLTGKFPYPARSMGELPELWLGEVPLVETLAPSVPERLSHLVMQLISLDRDGRPRTAGEVVERLSAIAGLELEDHWSVAGAYLTTPSLVEREAFITWTRGHIESLLRRRGQTLVIEGDPGMGRSRALDACVAEAKRVGAVVARATASAAASRDYGVAAALARQLLQQLPQGSARVGAHERAILDHVLEKLQSPGVPEQPPERRHIQAALRDWILGLSRHHRLMLAVDDIEQVDEPSASLLAMLAHEIERRHVIIAVTRKAHADAGLARDVLSRLGKTFALGALSEAKTEQLVRSVFGDVENVVGVAQRVHEIARGNPRDTMQLLRHLVERGIARCEGAAWLLPVALAEADLPSSMLSVFESSVSGLSRDARELAEALALTDPALLGLEDYAELADVADSARLFSALLALVQAGVLLPEGDRYRFAERNGASWLAERVAPERKRSLHARLANLAERRGDRMRRLHHLLESGQAELAIGELVAAMDTQPLEYSQQTLDLLERLVAASRELNVPDVQRVALKLRVVGVSSVVNNLEVFQRYAPEMLTRLRRDSGLDDWDEIGDGVADGERLQTALMRTQARYEATAEQDRGFSPFDSIRRLARLLMGYTGMSGAATDRDLVVGLPSLRPFFVLSPATAVVQRVVDGELAMEEGRVSAARRWFPEALARISEPDGAGIDPVVREQMKYGLTYTIAAIDASRGLSSTLTFADELDKVPKFRTNAWHVRRSYYRMLGHVEKVRDCQRRIELLQLRDGPQPLRNINFRSDLPACWLSDDFMGLKSSFSGIEAEARRFPRLSVLRELAHCHYHRLLGEYEKAFEHLAVALELAKPGLHLDWHYVASAHVQLLTLLGRPEEAIRRADAYEAVSIELGLDRALRGFELARIPALLAVGRAEEARERCDRQLALDEQEGIGGILLARCHEMRARIALALGDRAGFESWAERFAEFCRAAENPAIRAQYDRLIHEDTATGVIRPVVELAAERSVLTDRISCETLNSRMTHCIDRSERAKLALSLVLDACQGKCGHLFGVEQGNLELLGSIPECNPPENLQPALADLLEQERRGDAATMMVEQPTAGASAQDSPYARVSKLGFTAQLLIAHRTGDAAIVGLVVVQDESGKPTQVPADVAQTVAEALAERGDVDPVTCFVS